MATPRVTSLFSQDADRAGLNARLGDFFAAGVHALNVELDGLAHQLFAAGGGFDPGSIVNRLGKPWTLANPGVSIKPFPSGSLTHPAMGEILRLIRENNILPAQVEKIDVGGNHSMTTTLLHHHPTTGLQGKFSMEFLGSAPVSSK